LESHPAEAHKPNLFLVLEIIILFQSTERERQDAAKQIEFVSNKLEEIEEMIS